ncbi:Rha family transcriptional regulator [Vallitalea sp.]|jgi:Rha family phage regulatory protein|uniref:Rha family transcriptional regulator n=1 Tax=Vallitalea sp. TaxID=1882829 RepID=UPI0025FE51CA|nr:Rha family transcriptional regulator [Vallitalea sp.]MCT4685931.1 Rha family transcriptional regulator [Vallitalea sp.]
MNNLITKEIPQAIDSREVAEMVKKEHKNLLSDIRKYEGFLTSSNVSPLDFFQESTYKDTKGETRPCYNITKKGCEFIAHKLTGQKGAVFTATYINRFHELEQGQALQVPQVPHSVEDMIILQAQSMKELKTDVQENARRIDKLNDETYVTPEQKNYLQLARNKRVVELIGYHSKAYNDKSFRNRVYAELGRQYENYFKISSYGYTLKNKYEEAIKLIDSYNLSAGLSMELDIINSQKIA